MSSKHECSAGTDKDSLDCTIQMKFPEKVSVVLEKFRKENTLQCLSCAVFSVPSHITVFQFFDRARDRLKLHPPHGFHLLLKTSFGLKMSQQIGTVHAQHRDKHGFLHFLYAAQGTFGCPVKRIKSVKPKFPGFGEPLPFGAPLPLAWVLPPFEEFPEDEEESQLEIEEEWNAEYSPGPATLQHPMFPTMWPVPPPTQNHTPGSSEQNQSDEPVQQIQIVPNLASPEPPIQEPSPTMLHLVAHSMLSQIQTASIMQYGYDVTATVGTDFLPLHTVGYPLDLSTSNSAEHPSSPPSPDPPMDLEAVQDQAVQAQLIAGVVLHELFQPPAILHPTFPINIDDYFEDED